MNLPTDSSWTLRKIFGLRKEGQQFILSRVGNGSSTFLWLDNWCTLGPLFQKYGDQVSFNLGRSLHATVSSIIHHGSWRWPRSRHPIIIEIIANTDPNLIPHVDNKDSVIWTLNASGSFSIKSAWQDLRSEGLEVHWFIMVWFSRHVPRWSFILWLALLGRLSTKDRLRTWGLLNDCSCVLCYCGYESHSHLFFDCPFSSLIWKAVKSKCDLVLPDCDLLAAVHWGSIHYKDNSMQSNVFKLCIAASVYYIWKERNGRVFQQVGHDTTSVERLVVEEVKACMSSWRWVTRTAKNQGLIIDSGLPVEVLCKA